MTETLATLVEVVEELNGQVAQLRADLARRTRTLWVWALLYAILATAGLGYVLVGQDKAIRDQARMQQASCTVFADVGGSHLLTDQSSELARQIVADAAKAARIMGCGS